MNDGLEGIEVHVDELAALGIKSRARSQVVDAIAEKVLKKYKDPFVKEVAQSITIEEVRGRVLSKMVDEIIEDWRRNG